MTPRPDLPAPGSAAAPKYWRDETSGVLAAAVRAYLDNPEAMTLAQVAVMRMYLRQWIDSPAWDANPHAGTADRRALTALRNAAHGIMCAQDVTRVIHAAVAVGMDPL